MDPTQLCILILIGQLLSFLAGWQGGKASAFKRVLSLLDAKQHGFFARLPLVQTRALSPGKPNPNQRN